MILRTAKKTSDFKLQNMPCPDCGEETIDDVCPACNPEEITDDEKEEKDDFSEEDLE